MFQEALACGRAWCRRRTERRATDRNRAGRLGKCRNSCRKSCRNNRRSSHDRRRYSSRRMDHPRARIWTRDAGCRQRAADAGRRHRLRRLILQRVHLRRQQGELTGYSFQVRPLGRSALRERRQRIGVLLQRIGVLLLRRLNVPETRPDNGIRNEDRSRRERGDALRLRCGETAEVRRICPINARRKQLFENRPGEATETRHGSGGGGTDDGQDRQRNRDHRHPV